MLWIPQEMPVPWAVAPAQPGQIFPAKHNILINKWGGRRSLACQPKA